MTTRDEAPKERLSYEEVIAQLSDRLDELAGVERNTPQENVEVRVQVGELKLDNAGHFKHVDWETGGMDYSTWTKVILNDGEITATRYPEDDELRALNSEVYLKRRYGNITGVSVVEIAEPSIVVIRKEEVFSGRKPEIDKISIQVLTTPEHIQELKALDQRL